MGTFGPLMNSGFFLAGAGTLCFAASLAISDRRRTQRAGGALLIPAGLALVANAFFQTDIEGAIRTLHGTIHGFGGAFFFFTAPVGLLLVNYGMGRWRFVSTLVAFVGAVVVLAVNGALGLDAAGLAERVVILAVFSSLILTSFRLYLES